MKKVLVISLCLASCVIDKIEKVAVIKNDSKNRIVVFFSNSNRIDDSTIFFGPKMLVEPKAFKEQTHLTYNSEKLVFFFFDADSVYSRIKANKLNGIVKNSFLEKVITTKDELKINDTIYFVGAGITK